MWHSQTLYYIYVIFKCVSCVFFIGLIVQSARTHNRSSLQYWLQTWRMLFWCLKACQIHFSFSFSCCWVRSRLWGWFYVSWEWKACLSTLWSNMFCSWISSVSSSVLLWLLNSPTLSVCIMCLRLSLKYNTIYDLLMFVAYQWLPMWS